MHRLIGFPNASVHRHHALGGDPCSCFIYALFCVYFNVLCPSLFISSLVHERDCFKITPVISWNVEYVAVALCGRFWGIFLGYLKENLDKFQGKQVQGHSFPKMKRMNYVVVNRRLKHAFTVHCFDDIVLLMSLLAPADS